MIKIPTKTTEYTKRWQNNNKDHANYLRDRSKARSFIRAKATLEDLKELKELIHLREGELTGEERDS